MDTEIEYSCPDCGNKFREDDPRLGAELFCPICKSRLESDTPFTTHSPTNTANSSDMVKEKATAKKVQKGVHLTVFLVLFGLSAAGAAWVVVEHINTIAIEPYLADNFDLPWDPTRTGRRYLYFAIAFIVLGGAWYLLSRIRKTGGGRAWHLRIPLAATLLFMCSVTAGICSYELMSPGWTTVVLGLGADDDVDALRKDPRVFFPNSSSHLVMRVRSLGGMVSMARILDNVGYSAAGDWANRMTDERRQRRLAGVGLLFAALGSFVGAAVLTLVPLIRSKSYRKEN